MENKRKYTDLDVEIGLDSPRDWTKREFDSLDDFLRKKYDNLSSEEKLNNTLLSIKYTLEEYLNEEHHEKIINVGEFIRLIMKEMNIKQNKLANYINITPQNFNKYLIGERKFNVDLAMKFESLFKIDAEIWLNIQSKNELTVLRNLHKDKYRGFDIGNLLTK